MHRAGYEVRCVVRLVLLGAVMGHSAAARADASIQLHDVTAETGITFRHTDGGGGQRYIVEYVSAGLATFDYNGDGLLDIYFLNGAPLRGTKADSPPRDALWRNDGGFRFTDVTDEAGVGDLEHGLGVTAADFDNDGDEDLYVNNFGANALYRNNGDGTFTDIAGQAGVQVSNVGAATCFLDIEGDGDLDLFAGNYVKFAYETHVPQMLRGVPVYPSPLQYEADPDQLYRNNGDGTFADLTEKSGLGRHLGRCMGGVSADFDSDGDTDIFVGNDVMANYLFQNDGQGQFDEVGVISGFAYDFAGIPQGSMGVECGDYDNDGRLDFYVTSYQREMATLYHNLGDGFFEDVSRVTGAASGTLNQVTWGSGMIDFDNDGDRDLYVACGYFDDRPEQPNDPAAYYAQNILLMNTGGRFVDVSQDAGDGMGVKFSSRGAAFDDFDNDGDVDVVVLNSRSGPTVLRNDSPGGKHWIEIQLRGVAANRDGVGSQVKVFAGDLVQLAEVHSGRSYQSHFGSRLHFGLGPHARIDRIEVRWLGGGVQAVEDVAADQLLVITETPADLP